MFVLKFFRPALSVNIVAVDNGAGLSVDALLLTAVLESAGIVVTWSKSGPPKNAARFARLWGRRWPARRYDVNLFLERVIQSWMPLASVNALIPNPEWFPLEQKALLPSLDAVLCKTLDAEATFRAEGGKTQWLGFTAGDRFQSDLAASKPLRVLHLAGRSPMKGTAAVIDVWSRHPDWPELTVVRRPLNDDDHLQLPSLPNVRYITHRISDEECQALQNSHAVYLLPSEAEGYGQALVEGMSAGAVVVTTDGPPMNEVVQWGRGILVPAVIGAPSCLGRLYHVIPMGLEAAMAEIFSWPQEKRLVLGMAAREWYLSNDVRFRNQLPPVLKNLVSGLKAPH